MIAWRVPAATPIFEFAVCLTGTATCQTGRMTDKNHPQKGTMVWRTQNVRCKVAARLFLMLINNGRISTMWARAGATSSQT